MSILSRRQGPFLGLPQLDRGHPLAQGLVGCWTGAYGLPAGDSSTRNHAPELVRGLRTDALTNYAGTTSTGTRQTAAGQALYQRATTDGGVTPSAALQPTDRVSLFWFGVVDANADSNNPQIAGMYHNATNSAPFHSYGIYRPDNTGVVFSYNSGGSFGSLSATSVLSSAEYERPISFSATYGVGAVKGYKNGIEIATGSGISGITYNSDCRFGVDHHAPLSSRAGVSTVLCLVYNRELSPTEHLALALDPFQIFVKQTPIWALGAAPTGPQLVTTVTAGPGGGGGATGAIDTTGADLIVISASWWGGFGSPTVSFSDSKGNTWTTATLQASGTANDMRQQFAYCFNPTVGSGHTFTVSGSGSYPAIIVHAFSGTAGYSYRTRTGAGGNVSSLATGSVTPGVDGALLLTGWVANNATLPSGLAASGFTVTTKEGVGGTNFPGAAGYLVQGTAAAINPTWTWSSGTYETAASTIVFTNELIVDTAETISITESVTALLSAVRPQAHWANGDPLGTSTTTRYVPAFSTYWDWGNTTANFAEIPVAHGITVRNWRLRLTAAPGSGVTRTFTLYKNGSPTALEIAISDAATTGSDLADSVTFAAGDLAYVRETCTGGTPVDTYTQSVFEIANPDDTTFLYGFGDANLVSGTGGPNYVGLLYGGEWSLTAARVENLVAVAGTITAYRVELSSAPGSGKSRTCVIEKNGVAQDGTGGTPNTTITISDSATSGNTTFSLSVAAGDLLRLSCANTNTPANACVQGTVTFVSGTSLHYNAGGTTNDFASQSVTEYLQALGNFGTGTAWTTVESDRENIGPETTQHLSGMRISLDVAPGSGNNYVWTLRKNQADTVQTVTISGTNTTGGPSVADAVAVASADRLSLQSVPTSLPAQTRVRLAFDVSNESTDLTVDTYESITITESVTAQLTTVRLNVNAAETITVTDSVSAALLLSMQQVVFGLVASPSRTSTEYVSVMGVATPGTEATARHPWAATGMVRNLVVAVQTAPGAGNSWTITLRKNGADTALTCTISGTATTARLTGTDVSVDAGDLLALSLNPTSNPTATVRLSWSLEFENEGGADISAYGHGAGAASSTGAHQTGVFAALTSSFAATHPANVVAAPGNLTATYVAVSSAPSAGNGFTFYVNKNGVRQDGSGGTVDTAVALTSGSASASGTYTLPLVAGDLVYFEAVASGSFSSRSWAVAARFAATIDGQSQLCGIATTPSTSATTYAHPAGGGTAGTTPSDKYSIGGVTSVRLSNLRVNLSAAPGFGKTRALTLREDASPATLTTTISGTATTGSDLTHADVIDDEQVFDVRLVPTGSPTAADHSWGMVQEVWEEPLTVERFESLTITESVTTLIQTPGQLTVSLAEFISTRDAAPDLEVVTGWVVAENLTVTEAVTTQLAILAGISAHETVTVTDSTPALLFDPLAVHVHETITITENQWATPRVLSVTEPILRITDAVFTRLSPLIVQVSETIAIAEGALNPSHLPGDDALGLGPAPSPLDTSTDDYWLTGL